jgi:3-oxoacyl-[acyl-carrier-protein] synthase II
MTSERRVVITGLGAITPIGIGTDSFWKGLLAGCSGVALVTKFDCSAIATRIAAPVNGFDPDQYLDRKESKRMDRFVQFAVAASQMAVADAALDINEANRERVGVFIGSGIGGLATLEEQHAKMAAWGVSALSSSP